MKIKKSLIGLSIAFMGVTTLAGCGSKFNGLTIEMWETFGQSLHDCVKDYAKEFAALVKEHEGVDLRINVKGKGTYSDILGKVRNSFTDSSTPTIAVAYPDHVADYMSYEKTPGEYVVDLHDYVYDSEIGFGKEAWLGDEDDETDFIEEFWKESIGYQREGVFSIPFLKSTEVMLYDFNMLWTAYQKGCFETTFATLSNIGNLKCNPFSHVTL